MKNIYKVFMCIVALVAMQSVVSAQIGYSITDNNRDTTGLQQQYYRFDLQSGQGTLISNLVLNGQTIRREYEGLGSSGSILLGVAEFDTELCNTGSDPITGLASDVRIFRTDVGPYPQPNGVQNAIGPQIGETCFPAGFTETAAAYNQVDGFLYAIVSDDLLPASAPRSRLFRVSPTTGLATAIGGGGTGDITLTTGSGGDQNPYLDGLAILPDGRAYASEARFSNNPTQSPDPNVGDNGGLYRIFLTGPNTGRATFVKYLLPFDANRDTGLANNGNTLYLLLEDARIFITDAAPSTVAAVPAVFPLGNPAGSNVLSTPGCLRPISFPGDFCGDFEGFDIPNFGNGVR